MHLAVAVRLFEEGLASMGQAAKIARVTIAEFLDLLHDVGVPAVDYPPEELDDEVKVLL